MSIPSLFNTLGWLFAPAIFFSVILALIVCIKASIKSRSPNILRRAFLYSLLPFAISLVAAVFGLLFIAITGAPFDKAGGWEAVGKTCLAGLVLTSVPLVWTLLLGFGRPEAVPKPPLDGQM